MAGPRQTSGVSSLASSPTMVGAVTTLITIVAVFLAYNANSGLPFVPVHRVSVVLPNAARMLPSNEVRIGGSRVGVVEAVRPVDGAAQLDLKLDLEQGALPKDSSFRVRYRSAFGLKYLEVVRGEGDSAPEGFVFEDSDLTGTDPSANTAEVIAQTDFDDIYNTFDERTREAVRTTMVGFGDAFAGRGIALGGAIQSSRPLLRNLLPVARNLAGPKARLGRFVSELADYARVVAPIATTQAALFANAATTFAAMSEDPAALRETISEGPATLEAGLATLPGQRRFLSKVTVLGTELLPGARDLETALPTTNDAIETGTPVLARTPPAARDLADVFGELEVLVDDPSTGLTLERLGDVLADLKPTVRFLAPAQTVCNYFNYFFTFVPATIADEDQVGFTVRQRAMLAPPGPNVVDVGGTDITIPGEVQSGVAGYSGIQANGRAGGVPDPGQEGVFKPYSQPILHFNAYGPAGQQDDDCQAGQAGYTLGDLRVPGQPASSATALQADIPGSLGPTTAFFDENGDRVLRDTRVESRQP